MKKEAMTYRLIRSRRKTLAVEIDRDGEVIVRAPLNLGKKAIEDFLEEKRTWITTHTEKQKNLQKCRVHFSLSEGAMLRFLGENYPLVLRAGTHGGFDGEAFYLPQSLPAEAFKENCIFIYKNLAKKILKERLLIFAQKMDLMPTGFHVTNARTRWGSCSGKNSISFSWKLIMASPQAVDYVVVHELAHIQEHNHSAAFWQVVENILPDYKNQKNELTHLAKKLMEEDWS